MVGSASAPPALIVAPWAGRGPSAHKLFDHTSVLAHDRVALGPRRPSPRDSGPGRVSRSHAATRSSTSSRTTARRPPTSSRAGSAARCGAVEDGALAAAVMSEPTGAGRSHSRRRGRLRRAALPAGGRSRRSSRRRTRSGSGTPSPAAGPPRESRWEQPHLEIASAPLVAADPFVRRTHPRRPELGLPACVAMSPRRSASRPSTAGSGPLPRRVTQLINRGWSFARFDQGRVVLKARSPAPRRTPPRSRASMSRRPPGRGPGHRRHGRGRQPGPARDRAGRVALRQRLEHLRAGGVRQGGIPRDRAVRHCDVLSRP